MKIHTKPYFVRDELLGEMKKGRRGSAKILIPYLIGLPLMIGLLIYGIFHDEEVLYALSIVLLTRYAPTFLQAVIYLASVQFWLEKKEIVVRQKIITEKITRVPYDHIHGVSATSSVIERALRLVTLDIETSSDKSFANDKLRYIPKDEAYELMEYINGARFAEGAVSADEKAVEEAEDSVEQYDFSDYKKPKIIGYSFLRLRVRKIFIAIYGAALFVHSIDNLLESMGANESLTAFEESMSGASIESIVNTSMLIIMLLLSLSLIGIVIFECFRIYGFKITNTQNALLIRRGFFTEAISSIQKDRIYGVCIHQSIPQRIYGYATINIYVMGDAANNDKRDDTTTGEVVLNPCIKVDDIAHFLEVFIPEYALAHSLKTHLYLTKPAKGRIIRQSIYAYSTVLVLTYIVVGYLPNSIDNFFVLIAIDTLLTVTVLLIGVCAAIGVLWEIRQTSYAVDRGFLVKKKVRLETSAEYFPRRSLEYAQYKQTIWQLKPKLCDFVSETVAVPNISIDEMTVAEAQDIVKWVQTGTYAPIQHSDDEDI